MPDEIISSPVEQAETTTEARPAAFTRAIAIEPGLLDADIDLLNLPDPPWTPAALGRELFLKLARITGAGASSQIGVSLDPRTFGRARAKRLIQLEGASADEARSKKLLEDGETLQAIIDARLPASTGTARRKGAPPLKPSKTTRRERRY